MIYDIMNLCCYQFLKLFTLRLQLVSNFLILSPTLSFEQHIEDLTQEKFSLQRALEASRTLAESLASENSALTDSYNQQVGLHI